MRHAICDASWIIKTGLLTVLWRWTQASQHWLVERCMTTTQSISSMVLFHHNIDLLKDEWSLGEETEHFVRGHLEALMVIFFTFWSWGNHVQNARSSVLASQPRHTHQSTIHDSTISSSRRGEWKIRNLANWLFRFNSLSRKFGLRVFGIFKVSNWQWLASTAFSVKSNSPN